MPVLRSPQSLPSANELRRILHMQVPVIVKLAERKLTLAEVMRLGPGAIIEFLKSNDEPLELLINNKAIGLGDKHHRRESDHDVAIDPHVHG